VVPELEAAWLFKIAHNVCLSRRRSAWRRGRIESPADFEVIEELTPAPSRRADELIGLQEVLERLPETQRRAILLREWQGLSYREIAAELELSQGAVETLIFRARRSLAAGLESAQPAKKGLQRLRQGSNLGTALVALKSLVAGSAAVVAAGSVAAAGPVEPLRHHFGRPPASPAGPSHRARPHVTKSSAASLASVRTLASSSPGSTRSAAPHGLRVVTRHAPPAPAPRATRHVPPPAAAPAPPAPAAAAPAPPPAPAPEPPKQPEVQAASSESPPPAEPERTVAAAAPAVPQAPAAEEEHGKGKEGKDKGKSGDEHGKSGEKGGGKGDHESGNGH
ncbi:MAG: hypothetical protein QOK13_618, partial [Gaiellaceae bacterium]|nr:hypothetical protein [Gaiellaceae bacterium]